MTTTATHVKLVNESALGIYVMSWQSKGRKRNVITWCEGMSEPALEFYVSGRNAMSRPLPIRNPERFGWKTPVRLATFKAFAQAFADEAEREEN
jgi:hypothetical protein